MKQEENINNHDVNDTLMDRQTCVIVYCLIIMSLIVSILIRSSIFVSVTMRSSIELHKNMFNAMTKATMSFFNTNSSGKNINM